MTPRRRLAIRKEVETILAECRITKAPVDIERVARHLGAQVHVSPFDGELAGMLVRRGGAQPVIGVNSLHHPNRRRFTIAHECGHLRLHQGEVHIDRSFRDSSFRINRRDEKSGMAVDKDEIEANFFAAELLMPQAMIERDLEAFDVDVEDEAELGALAKRYQVSLQALIHRVNNLLRHA